MVGDQEGDLKWGLGEEGFVNNRVKVRTEGNVDGGKI